MKITKIAKMQLFLILLFCLGEMHAASIVPDDKNISKMVLDINFFKIKDIAFTADGNSLFLASDNFVEEWDLSTMKNVAAYNHSATNISLAPTNFLAATVSPASIILWDFKNNKRVKSLGPYTGIRGLRFSPDGNSVVVGFDSGEIKLLDCKTKECIKTINCYMSVTAIAFRQDGNVLAIGSSDGMIKLWDRKLNNFIREFSCGREAVSSIAFRPDGSCLFYVTGIGTSFKFWDLKKNRCIHEIDCGTPLYHIEVSHDGTRIAAQSYKAVGVDQILIFTDLYARMALQKALVNLFTPNSLQNGMLALATAQSTRLGANSAAKVLTANELQLIYAMSGVRPWVDVFEK